MMPKLNINSRSGIIFLILLIVSFTILAFGDKLTTNNWGLGQTALLPSTYFIGWLILAAVAIVLAIPVYPKSDFYDVIGEFLWGKYKIIGRLAGLAAALTLFILYRFDAHLLGDGYIRISNFAQTSQPIFKWYEYGSTVVPYFFYYTLLSFGVEKVPAAEWGYQITSFLAGIVFIYVVIEIAFVLFKDDYRRIIFSGLILFSGLSLFFFGMVENTPILIPILGLFLLSALKLNETGKRLYLLITWGVVLIGIFFHIYFLIAIPAALYLTLDHFLKIGQKSPTILWILPGISIVGGIAALYLMAGSDIGIADKILFLGGKLPESDYSLFGSRHLTDIVNLIFLLVPFFLIYLFGIINTRRREEKDRHWGLLMILAVSSLVLLFIMDCRNGMGRDFNKFAPLIAGFIFWGAYALAGMKDPKVGGEGWLLPAALILILPTFAVQLSPERTIEYVDRYLTYNEYKYEPALLAFRDYYFIDKDYTQADLREGMIVNKVKGALESRLVNDLFYGGRFSEAYDYAVSLVQRFPYNATYRMQKGNMLKHYKKYDEAEQELKTAIMLEPYRAELYHFLIDFYRERENEVMVSKYTKKALALEPRNTLLMTDLLSHYYRTGQDISADSLANEILEINDKEAYPLMFKGLIAERNGRYQDALNYYEQFVKTDDKLPDVPIIRKRLNNLFLMLNDSTRTR
jgi:tetratricopeptide (TPR) repeat protein